MTAGIVSGQAYTFRWRVKSIIGTSDPSPLIQILAASVPDQPNPPTTTVDAATGNLIV